MSNYSEQAEERRQFRRGLEASAAGGHSKVQVNDFMLLVLVIIAALVSLTELEFSWGSISRLTALTIFLYIITTLVFRNSYAKGLARGKQDKTYNSALSDYRTNRQTIYDRSIANLVPRFCREYRKEELQEYKESLLLDIEMPYEEYLENYSRLRYREVMRLPLSMEAKKIILKCNRAKSIKLYPGMILNENGEYDRDKLIGKSGKQRERIDKRYNAISRAIYVIFGSFVVAHLIFDFSLLTIIQWVIRMIPVVVAIISGDDGGYCNITVTETNFKYGQTKVIKLFLERYQNYKAEPDEVNENEGQTE